MCKVRLETIVLLLLYTEKILDGELSDWDLSGEEILNENMTGYQNY